MSVMGEARAKERSGALGDRLSRLIERADRFRIDGFAGYLAAVAFTGVAALVRVPLVPFLGSSVPLATFFPAVILTAFIAGTRPAIVATALSFGVVWWWLVEPHYSFDVDRAYLGGVAVLFFGVSFLDIALIRGLRRVLDELARNSVLQLQMRRNEAELRVELERTNERLATALRAARLGTYEWLPQTGEAFWDRGTYAIYGVDPATSVSVELLHSLVHPEDLARFEESMGDTLDPANGRRDIRYRIVRGDDGRTAWVHADGDMEFEDGRPVRLVGTVRDVTELAVAETGRELVIRELNHRVKNLFAVVLSIVSLSGRGKTDAAQVVASIRERIHALSVAHGASLGHGDGMGMVELHALLSAIMRPYLDAPDDDGPPVTLTGNDVALAPRMVTPVGLVMHELSTNANKYGALSAEDGRVEITWRTVAAEGDASAPTLHLSWREHVATPPPFETAGTPGGFGWRMIRTAAAQMGATVDRSMTRTGLHVDLVVPLDAA